MSTEQPERRRKAAFLLSFWLEPGSDASGGTWRGSVEHLGSGRRLYFNQIASLVGFLASWLERGRLHPTEPEWAHGPAGTVRNEL